jgi:repressor LexA
MGRLLTRLEKRILGAIREHHTDYSEMPTIRQIGKTVGVKSPGTVGRYINALIDKGYLERQPRIWRGLKLIQDEDVTSLPLMGRIAAGLPIEAITGENELNPNELLGGSNRYALQITGNSMIEAGIHDKDWVIIQIQDYADNGQIVVALINNTEATLKYLYYRPDDRIELRPANSSLQSMIYKADQILIQGILAAQMRTYL